MNKLDKYKKKIIKRYGSEEVKSDDFHVLKKFYIMGGNEKRLYVAIEDYGYMKAVYRNENELEFRLHDGDDGMLVVKKVDDDTYKNGDFFLRYCKNKLRLTKNKGRLKNNKVFIYEKNHPLNDIRMKMLYTGQCLINGFDEIKNDRRSVLCCLMKHHFNISNETIKQILNLEKITSPCDFITRLPFIIFFYGDIISSMLLYDNVRCNEKFNDEEYNVSLCINEIFNGSRPTVAMEKNKYIAEINDYMENKKKIITSLSTIGFIIDDAFKNGYVADLCLVNEDNDLCGGIKEIIDGLPKPRSFVDKASPPFIKGPGMIVMNSAHSINSYIADNFFNGKEYEKKIPNNFNPEISPLGEKQATHANNKLITEGIFFDKVYTSPFKKCQQTLSTLIDGMMTEVIVANYLGETGKLNATSPKDVRDSLKYRVNGFSACTTVGIYNFHVGLIRHDAEITKLIDDIKSELSGGDKIIGIMTHDNVCFDIHSHINAGNFFYDACKIIFYPYNGSTFDNAVTIVDYSE